MSGEPGPPSRVKRMLPSVSEVLKELTARASVEPDVAFRAAREVCAEELKRIRDAGGDSVPLEELVQRAYRRVTGKSLPGAEPPAAQTEIVPVFDAAEEDPFAVPPPPPAAPAGDEPFLETSGALDLQWDEGREPLAGAPGAGAASAAPLFLDVPAAPAGAGPAPTESLPVPFALPADEPPAPVAEVFPTAPGESGPGDETLSRLSREAEAIELHDVFPHPGAREGAARPSAYPVSREAAAPQPEVPPPFEDDEDTVLTVPRGGRKGEGRPRIGLVLGVVGSLAALAGLGYLLVGLWMERDATPAPVAVARPRAEKPAPPAPSPAPAEAAAPAEAPGADAPAAVVPGPTPGPAAALPPPPAPVVASPAPAAAPSAAPAPALPPPPAPVVAATPARAVPRSRDGLVVTRDRAGQPQVYSIHFTSYKDRPSAERDLVRVEGMAGMKGYVAEVDLGEKGVWQRVMVGAFATAEEAKAVRADLAAKGTRDMGWVYRVVGPDGASDR